MYYSRIMSIALLLVIIGTGWSMAIISLAIDEERSSSQQIQLNNENSSQSDFKINPQTLIQSKIQRSKTETIEQSTPTPKNQITQAVGDTRIFSVLNLDVWDYYEINATLILEGAHSLIFTDLTVDGALSNVIHSINTSFETNIHPTLTSIYGPPPDVDKNEKVIILIIDIIDQYEGKSTTSYVAGFFDPLHEYGQYDDSNKAEILFIDGDEGFNKLDNGEFETIAHEFQHLIHFRNDVDENVWLDEAASMLAEYLIGENPFDGGEPYESKFESLPDVSLTYWDYSGSELVYANYGAAFAFFLYLLEHYGGTTIIQDIVKSKNNSILSVEQSLNKEGYPVEFKEVFRNWTIANYLDDISFANGTYGYKAISLEMKLDNYPYTQSSIPRTENSVPYWGTDYLMFSDRTDTPFILEFKGDLSSDFMVTVILTNITTPNTEVIPIEISSDNYGNFSTEVQGISADEIVLAISAYTPLGKYDHSDEHPAPSQDYWFMVNPKGIIISPGNLSFSSDGQYLRLWNIKAYDQNGFYWKEADGATYNILTDSGNFTGIGGNLAFNFANNYWEATDIDLSTLPAGNTTYRIKYHFFNSTCSGIAFSETFEIIQPYSTQSSSSTTTDDTSIPGFMLVISLLAFSILIGSRKKK
ncbi:MAG: hypothetical protein JSU57_01895 [Candidatus Heimdallarchaeota archaeon]|nr:MAG: hypothetical protein JSU57_01895 [Candidatus Heimdallarchaeota archaeon]